MQPQPVNYIPQPHGGALTPGNWGNRGGHGNIPNALRIASRDGYSDVIALVESWVKDIESQPTEKKAEVIDGRIDKLLNALDKLGKYSIGETRYTPEQIKGACVSAFKEAFAEPIASHPELFTPERIEEFGKGVQSRLE